MWYITTAEANTYLETSWEDVNIATIIDQASKMIDQYCWRSFAEVEITWERHKYNYNWPYYLKQSPKKDWLAHPERPILKINWVASIYVEWIDYIMTWRRILFASNITIDYDETFNIVTFDYKSWLDDMSQIKDACFMIVSWLYNSKKTVWLTQLTQWDISTTFSQILSSEQYHNIKLLLSKYKTLNVVS